MAVKDRLSTLFNLLVPSSGPSNSQEGELVRAISRILYRYCNDGDYWYSGYGCTVCGPAATFISDYANTLSSLMKNSEFANSNYEHNMIVVAEKVCEIVENSLMSGLLHVNKSNMEKSKSKYEEEEEEGDEEGDY